MKLESTDGQRVITLSHKEHAAACLTAKTVAELADLLHDADLGTSAVKLVDIANGDYPHVLLPNKRKPKEQPVGIHGDALGPVEDIGFWNEHKELATGVPEQPATLPPQAALARKTGPQCAECKLPLSRGELRHERSVCFLCRPIDEGATAFAGEAE